MTYFKDSELRSAARAFCSEQLRFTPPISARKVFLRTKSQNECECYTKAVEHAISTGWRRGSNGGAQALLTAERSAPPASLATQKEMDCRRFDRLEHAGQMAIVTY